MRLQWTKEPPRELVVSVNQDVKLDCLAHGEPRASMRWEKLAQDAASRAAKQQLAQSPPTTTTTTGELASITKRFYYSAGEQL